MKQKNHTSTRTCYSILPSKYHDFRTGRAQFLAGITYMGIDAEMKYEILRIGQKTFPAYLLKHTVVFIGTTPVCMYSTYGEKLTSSIPECPSQNVPLIRARRSSSVWSRHFIYFSHLLVQLYISRKPGKKQ
jgi:hypothetical protein